MKNSIILLKVAGGINLLFLLFHLPFYWMFGWEHTLSGLNPNDRNILLTFNIIGNILLLYFTFTLLWHTKSILDNALGKLFLWLVAFFYGIRIFAEFYFWGYQGISSLIIIILCAIPVICCLIPVFRSDVLTYKRVIE